MILGPLPEWIAPAAFFMLPLKIQGSCYNPTSVYWLIYHFPTVTMSVSKHTRPVRGSQVIKWLITWGLQARGVPGWRGPPAPRGRGSERKRVLWIYITDNNSCPLLQINAWPRWNAQQEDCCANWGSTGCSVQMTPGGETLCKYQLQFKGQLCWLECGVA